MVGPTAVGKSTVGWRVLNTLWERGVTAAYVDVDQLGFSAPETGTRLKAENLVRVWQGYRDAGARALIVVARGAPDTYGDRARSPTAPLTRRARSVRGSPTRVSSLTPVVTTTPRWRPACSLCWGGPNTPERGRGEVPVLVGAGLW